MISIKAPLKIQTTIKLPASKSISNRALVMHALSQRNDDLVNLSDCDDTNVMQAAFTNSDTVVNIKAAGTAMRFLTSYFCTQPGRRVLTGTSRMKQRPIHVLVDALRKLGAEINYVENDGFPPLEIQGGKLKGGELCLRGDVSSQFISSILMISPILPSGLSLQLTGDVISKPYINLTLRMMTDFGASVAWKGERTICVAPQAYQQKAPYFVESDWSGASYWYEIASLVPEADITLLGLKQESYQGDSEVAKLFKQLGVETTYSDQGVHLIKTNNKCDTMQVDFKAIPDLAQTFVVTCCLLQIPFHFSGLQSLKIKETDRIEALKTEMRKLGYVLHDKNNDTLYWNGERCEEMSCPSIDTYDDHRMAMAFAPAALIKTNLIINKPEVVSKSYPNYWQDLERAGFSLFTEENT